MALIQLGSIVEKPIERLMGMNSTSLSNGITYSEKGSAVIADNATGFYIPTKLRQIDIVHMVPTDTGGQVSLAGSFISTNPVVRAGAAQAGGTNTSIVLDAGASASDSIYVGLYAEIKHADGTSESVKIITYTGATRTATLSAALKTVTGATTTFKIYGVTVTCLDPGTSITGSFIWETKGKQ